ncbi:MAG: peptidase M14, partial [Calditrichaeota bacterium]|nr:peptidase M14 [Calditrichota bacterium]
MKSRFLQLFIVLTVAVLVAFADEQPDWRTDYEKSGYLETPRYAATIDYCQRLAAASDWVQFASFGKSPQGRDLPLLIVDKNGNFDPAAVRKSGNLVLLIQNGIHSGEIDGKDASLMLIREMVITKKLAHLLDGVTAIFIPIFNVDGHENVSEYNRLNQNGPAEMGFRATAQNLNLNRDFLKAESPEMRAWLQLFNQWLPDFLVDNHVTDGSDHQYVLTYGVETNDNVAEPLRRWTTGVFQPKIEQQMLADKQPVMRYFSMKERPEIINGVVMEPYSPRYSTGYGAVQNRVFLLVETHALKDYRTRVTGNYLLMQHLFELLNSEKTTLQSINRETDDITARQLSGTTLPLDYVVNYRDTTWVDFLGIDY